MPAYALFAGGTLVLVVLVVALARLTQQEIVPDPDGGARLGEHRISVRDLYTNVVLSQVIVVGLLIGLIWLASMPSTAFGIGDHGLTGGLQIGLGIVLGVLLYLANEASVTLFDRLGVEYSEDLRSALAPEGPLGWGLLLVVVLPVIAAAEELVFRAAMIGGLAAGFDISPLLLVILSSIAFALGHGMQGTGGVLVTGGLGLVLGGAFVLSGSLLLVIVAHYVVNVLEFVVHEGLGMG